MHAKPVSVLPSFDVLLRVWRLQHESRNEKYRHPVPPADIAAFTEGSREKDS